MIGVTVGTCHGRAKVPMSGQRFRRSVVLALVPALLGSALAVAINLATEWKYSVLAWVVVGVLTVLTAAVSLLVSRAPSGTEPGNTVRFGDRVRSRRLRVRGRRNVLRVGDDATIDDIDISSGPR
ncbi:hypothetical protein BLA60_00200 [Actinophytocola xinjiangensis]|uniref:Uncharacterized protein n=2 Tax=Actinophytocola xinjiangensis TaxID=485602 RepID=A0A7Z0WR04_9PSEU|nr:hypothetical protein BLA60_00200 [Actinophytocola xinjiangensis]